MPTNLLQQIVTSVTRFQDRVGARLAQWRDAKTPEGFGASESEIAALGRDLCDEVTSALLKEMLSDVEFQAAACASALQAPGIKRRSSGSKDVTVDLLGGGSVRVRVPYLKRDHRGRPGRKRKSGRRGKGGTGLYPTLAALGIWYRATPALASEVVQQVAASDAVRPAREALARRGIDVGYKRTLGLVNFVAGRAVEQRERWFDDVRRAAPVAGGQLAGRRVVVGTDGGRIRMRLPARCGRRRAKTRHRGYSTPWQEPKVLVIYVIDARGKVEQTFRPVYDATMGDCNEVFAMLVAYLRALGAHEAVQLIVVGDGAKWIWGRVPELTEAVGIEPDKVVEVIDWYHATEKLHTIAKIPSRWTEKRRNKWTRTAIRYLRAGKIDRLVQHIESMAIGRRAKKVKSHIDYFDKNVHRMQYARFRAENIPWGSGAVESAVRRIINLRLKSPGKFWLECNAEGMLLARSYLKAGRFDDLFEWSLRAAAPWWAEDVLDPLTPSANQEPESSTPDVAPVEPALADPSDLAA